MRIGMIGIGRMGMPMAQHLMKAGHELIAYNRTREKAASLSGRVTTAASPAEAARDVDALLTMLADDRAVEAMVLGEAGEPGVLSALRRGAIHISCSTISVGLARRLAAAHAAAEHGYVSAPVFGRPEAAQAQKLWVVAAGSSALLDRCQPIFEAVGQGVFRVGDDPAMANAVKLAGNFTIAAMLETLGEAFAFIRKAGVDPQELLAVLNTALYRSPIYENYGRLIADGRYEPAGFALRLGLKDVRLALEASDAVAAPMPLASLLHDHLLSQVARGRGEADWAAVAEVSARNAGL
ncbi:MAG TPA: NAD(P)-dependent oxidoreductase [Vicinamibacterales bacterium]|jgi:3-hydroxyisobutyrate dehydrogenase-like beta-hydroxyacid dehydrogenase